MKIKNYHNFWKNIGQKNSWREYILPKRNDTSFFNEGKLEAKHLSEYLGADYDSILEYGCGIGRILKNFNCKTKVGVDVCQAYLDKIDDKTIIKIKTDGHSVDYADNTIDRIYSIMVFQHTNKEDHTQMIKNLYNILSDGGVMLIQFPQNPNDYYRDTSFVNIYSIDEIKGYCKAANINNFDIIEENLVGYGDGLTNAQSNKREYFLIIRKNGGKKE
jgi:cyclopropane fatty-acyl-phospholipid synthase-like methyltransferase